MNYSQQVVSHLAFLQSLGLAVEELTIGEFVRCRSIDDAGRGRGEYTYRTTRNPMARPGLVGLSTWARAPGGEVKTHKTYGNDAGFDEEPVRCQVKVLPPREKEIVYSEEIASRSREIWESAKLSGTSPYLESKGVKAHGVRFLKDAAVIPARDNKGILRNLQFLNHDGQKRFMAGSTILGLFHLLGEPVNSQKIGISESYATSATCVELTGMPVVCAFSSDNLAAVTQKILDLYPASSIVIFADNDRHLVCRDVPLHNKGVLKAQEAQKLNSTRVAIAVPDFGDLEPAKTMKDWNDLTRLRGLEEVRTQIKGLICPTIKS